jgi:hypothetical protein
MKHLYKEIREKHGENKVGIIRKENEEKHGLLIGLFVGF